MEWRTSFLVLITFGLNSLIHTSLSCEVNDQDSYIINRILENELENDCEAIYTLAGIFFEDQEKPPNAVRVKYIIQIPYDTACSLECSCWRGACSRNCTPGHCCIEREFLWGRIPLYVQEGVFRELTMCSLIVGGLKESELTLRLNVSNERGSQSSRKCLGSIFPCSWCHKDKFLTAEVRDAEMWIDNAVTLRAPISPLDKALLTLTAKLQGYAAKAEKLDWLVYKSDLAFGYSAPYKTTVDIVHFVTFFASYVFFHMMLFMLVYKYRYRLYSYICKYIHQSTIHRSLFRSFILTSLIGYSCIMVTTLLADGICITNFQIIMLSIAVTFGLSHSCIVCFRMKKTANEGLDIITDGIKSRFVFTKRFTQIVLFSYLYFLPHMALFFMINVSASFISKPFSNLILLVYLAFSYIFVWVSNAIAINLLCPISCGILRKKGCRRQIFAVCMIIACNFSNFTIWGFIEILYYDNRGRAASFIAVLPGVAFTMLGWYLKGDLVIFFDKLLRRPNTKEDISNSYDEKHAISGDEEESDLLHRQQNRVASLIQVVKNIRRSVSENSPERRCSYVRMNTQGQMNDGIV